MNDATASLIVGRQRERRVLHRLLQSNKPELLAVYGRRRVGKTFLIREFFSAISPEQLIFFSVSGEKDGPLANQIAHFTERLSETFSGGLPVAPGSNWDAAFKMLKDAMSHVTPNKKIVLFFDEFPWMATKNSRLLQTFDYYWNQYFSTDSRINVIICGSSASWIINKIINNRGGLHNRITESIHLQPFTLRETQEFLHANGVNLNQEHVTELYVAMGGIPYYLNRVQKAHTATQSVGRLAFQPGAPLQREFDNLFASLFDDAEPYVELLRIIANKHYGLTQAQLARRADLSSDGGRLVARLKELEDAGFLMSFRAHGHQKKGVYYRVIDEYTLFYLRWIEPIKGTPSTQPLAKDYWENMHKTAAWNSWMGYAFESICYKHIQQIRTALDIPATAIAGSWRYVPNKGSSEQGAQIDLLFDRRDDALTLCEIKYTSKPFVIDKEYAKNLLNKAAVFAERTRDKRQVFFAMITAQGLANNFYADDLIAGVVTLDDLFKPDE